MSNKPLPMGNQIHIQHPRKCENATEKPGECKGSRRSRSSDVEKNGESRECETVSSPLVDVESTSDEEEKATSSTPRHEDYDMKESSARNKHAAADPLDLGDYKRTKWSSYSQAETESSCKVNQNPDDEDLFSIARCRNILHGMRHIDQDFRDTALDFLEDPYYRKFFIQMKHNKRLDWLNSILGAQQ